MMDQSVRRHARRPARRAHPAREPAVSQGRRASARCSRRRGRRTKRSSRRSSRTTACARGLDALVTELQRVAQFGFTATELARAKQARMLGYERSRDREPGPRVRRAAPTSTRATSCRAKRCRRSGRSSRSIAASCPAITLAEINALAARLVPRAEPAGDRRPRRRRPASPCRSRRSSPPSSRPRPASSSTPTSTPAPGSR